VRWRLLIEPEGISGAENMATDQALLEWAEATGEGCLRCYAWSPFCLSFGRHEPAARRFDRTAIESAGIDTVRRPTGGRAVWHARELTYAVAAPVEAFGSLPRSYAQIHQAIATALQDLGVAAQLAPAVTTPSLTAGACFSSPVGGEVTVDGSKLVGSAQLRQGGAFLQHGSLLLAGDQSRASQLLREPTTVGQVTTLERLLGRTVAFGELAERIAGALVPAVGEWRREPPAGLAARVAVHRPRFEDPAWTWRR